VTSQKVRLKIPRFNPEHQTSENNNDANIWFSKMFPDAAKRFGAGFMQGTHEDLDGFKRFIPVELNEDVWAAALDDRRVGMRVVYFAPEAAWWFFDYRVDAFRRTTSQKLKLLLSNLLIRCAEESGSFVDIENLVVKFREDEVLNRIIAKAEALLAAEHSFFHGANGHKRVVSGRIIHPNEQPAYVEFVKKAIVRQPEAKLTIGDAFHRYYAFCKEQRSQPLTRSEFKSLVAEVIREEFRIGLRHDIVDGSGKQQHGWLGIDCRLQLPEAAGRN